MIRTFLEEDILSKTKMFSMIRDGWRIQGKVGNGEVVHYVFTRHEEILEYNWYVVDGHGRKYGQRDFSSALKKKLILENKFPELSFTIEYPDQEESRFSQIIALMNVGDQKNTGYEADIEITDSHTELLHEAELLIEKAIGLVGIRAVYGYLNYDRTGKGSAY